MILIIYAYFIIYVHLFNVLGKIVEVLVPEDVPVDIRAKLMVCLIHQHVFKPLDVSDSLKIFHQAR